jgi:hypothetical protein
MPTYGAHDRKNLNSRRKYLIANLVTIPLPIKYVGNGDFEPAKISFSLSYFPRII